MAPLAGSHASRPGPLPSSPDTKARSRRLAPGLERTGQRSSSRSPPGPVAEPPLAVGARGVGVSGMASHRGPRGARPAPVLSTPRGLHTRKPTAARRDPAHAPGWPRGRTGAAGMDDQAPPWAGSCRCGEVRFAVTAPPLPSAACHRTGCRAMTASAFSLALAILAEGFAVTEGERVIGGLHRAARHLFCRRRLSPVFTRREGPDEIVDLRAAPLDEHAWFAPFIEAWTGEGLFRGPSPCPHGFETESELAAHLGLIDDFARRGARPGRGALPAFRARNTGFGSGTTSGVRTKEPAAPEGRAPAPACRPLSRAKIHVPSAPHLWGPRPARRVFARESPCPLRPAGPPWSPAGGCSPLPRPRRRRWPSAAD